MATSILAWKIPWTEQCGRLTVHGVPKIWAWKRLHLSREVIASKSSGSSFKNDTFLFKEQTQIHKMKKVRMSEEVPAENSVKHQSWILNHFLRLVKSVSYKLR